MIDTSKFSEQELDFILDALDAYEEKSNFRVNDFERLHMYTEMLEGHIRRMEDKGEQNEGDAKDMLARLDSVNAELRDQEKKMKGQRRNTRDRVALLKAKIIMLRDSKAADRLWEEASEGPAKKKSNADEAP